MNTMSKIKRLKVSFIDKDNMKAIEDTYHVLVHVNRDNELVADYYTDGPKREVEIKIIDDGSTE